MNNSTSYSCLSLWPLDMPLVHLIAWASFLALLSPITVVSNLALLYALHKTKQFVSITNKFIFVMSISDLCTGLFVLPGIVTMIALRNKFRSCTFEIVMQFFAFVLAYFSFFMLMSVSIDRYLSVTKPHRYKALMSNMMMKVVVLVSFIVSCSVAAVSITTPSFVLQVLLNLSDLLGVLIISILYALVFSKITEHTENIRKYFCEKGSKDTKRAACREISATKTIRVLLITLFALYLPYNILSAIWTFHKFHRLQEPGLTLDVLEYLSYVIVFANASANAIIFGLGNTKTRKFMKRRLGFSLTRQQSSTLRTAATSEASTNSKKVVI